ncbi:MAG: hypothetical protein WCO44_01790 [Bacteroidota bacterium]
MKAKILTAVTVLILQAGLLFAGNETTSAPASSERSSTSLAPVTPAEATFEEFIPVRELFVSGPVTPVEATFEEITTETPSVADFAPGTPAGADFEDAAGTLPVDTNGLAPIIKAEADFE